MLGITVTSTTTTTTLTIGGGDGRAAAPYSACDRTRQGRAGPGRADRAEIARDGALNNDINCISYSRKLLVTLAN